MKREMEAVETEVEGATEGGQQSTYSEMLPEILSLMSEVGYDVNQTTVLSSGLSSLVYAVFKKHCPSVRLLLAAPGIDVNRPELTHGQTPLYAAAWKGQEACTGLLLAAPGIDVNRPDSTHGLTPLYVAAQEGHETCTRLLLAAPGIDVNRPTTAGQTPLFVAAQEGQETCTRLLLAAPGIDVNRPESTIGQTPLYTAAGHGHEACTRLLLAAPGIDVNYSSKDEQSVLAAAAYHVMQSLRQLGSEDTTRVLVQLLAARQVTDQVLEQTISFLQRCWLTNTQVIEMEASGQSLHPQQEAVRLLLPVLRAQSLGERRWCGHC